MRIPGPPPSPALRRGPRRGRPAAALLLSLSLVIAGCRGHAPFDYSKEPDPRQREYVIGPSDQLSVEVWRNPELSREVTVRPDGTVTLPLIGDLRADGKTPTELRDEIGRQLTKFIKAEGTVVTVAVTAVNSYSFTISGNIERPGVYSSPKYLTVLEAIQLAGGPNRFASPRGTILTRRPAARGAKPRAIPVDYTAILEGKRPEANLVLLPGDQLFIP